MRRFLTIAFLLSLTVPFGVSISGCYRNPGADYCDGTGTGPKKSEINRINLDPKYTGVTLAFGQTTGNLSATALNCSGDTISVGSFSWAVADPTLVDLSPSGTLCAGTWNRVVVGGVPAYTVCTPGTRTGSTYITASAAGVSSNRVYVYIHPFISSLELQGPNQCLSQNETSTLDVTAYYDNNGIQTVLCSPTSTNKCSSVIGPISYTSSDSTIASIDTATGILTAHAPGTTTVTANVTSSKTPPGYISGCPPASIALTFPDGATTQTLTSGLNRQLTATAVDTKGNSISGLAVDYISTNPVNIPVSASGSASTTYPGEAAIYAVCQPTNCNPAPVDHIGLYGTGLPVISNVLKATAEGSSKNYIWVGSPESASFVQIDLQSNTIGTPNTLPFTPNSMVLDPTGSDIYFGSSRELMVYSAINNTLAKEDLTVPGVVIGVSPDNTRVIINDQDRKVIYIYSPSSNAVITKTNGIATSVAFSRDVKDIYITGTDISGVPTLFVYNSLTGWATPYTLPATPSDITVTVPDAAAYFASSTATSAVGFCPNLATGVRFPAADSVPVINTHLSSTVDGKHIVGALSGSATINDIGVTIPQGACPASGLTLSHTLTQAVLSFAPETVTQVVTAPSPTAPLSFITYSGSTAPGLPYYNPNTQTTGVITLTGAAGAPRAGVFSQDNKQFYTATAGDNLVHIIDVATLKDVKQFAPTLKTSSGTTVPGLWIATKPKSTN